MTNRKPSTCVSERSENATFSAVPLLPVYFGPLELSVFASSSSDHTMDKFYLEKQQIEGFVLLSERKVYTASLGDQGRNNSPGAVLLGNRFGLPGCC